MRKATIHGYCDRPSAAPGERIRFHVSCEAPGPYRADIVRLINGDTNPAGPGFLEEEVDTAVNGEYEGRFQATYSGSYVEIEDGGALGGDGALAVHAFVQPTTPAKGAQGIVTRWDDATGTGWALIVDDAGRLAFRVGDGSSTAEVASDRALLPWVWFSVSASYDPASGRVRVSQEPVVNSVNSLISPIVPLDATSAVESSVDVRPGRADAPVLIAAWSGGRDGHRLIPGGTYNGKIDAPRVYGRALGDEELAALRSGHEPDGGAPLAHWSMGATITRDGYPDDSVRDVAGSLHGTCVNTPTRAVTGWNWQGREEHFAHAPEQYGAVHFHDDDLDDCRWEADFELEIPESMGSDVYAARLVQGESEDYVPFFVLPPRGTTTSKVLVMMPTASYLAYANDHIAFDVSVSQAILGHTAVLAEQDFYLYQHTEFGLSTYDAHSDGSGVAYTSWRRPIINMRPKFRHVAGAVWQFPADMHLICWLNTMGLDYDVATDHDLQAEGVELLQRYNVVISPSHAEYTSVEMLDSYETYLAGGGRVMYLGSNGFYWIISWHPEHAHIMEVRKGESGSRAWQAKPGEYHHAFGGLRGGLWRNRARPPQKTFGVGFTSEGFDRASYFVPMPDAADPRVAFIMEGIEADERIGDFGLAGGGAAGYEIDRYELALGTPPHAMLVAASEGHSVNYPHVVEEIYFNFPGLDGTQDPQVRADIVYFDTTNGGAVFSSSSISWCGSLPWNGADNNVSRMTANVLRQFARDEPAPKVS